MLRIRYMIVDHPDEVAKQLGVVGDKFVNTALPCERVPIHHWQRLDNNIVIVKGTYLDQHHKWLLAHPGITVLPATFSRKTVASAINDQGTHHHLHALQKHPMPFDDHTITSDIVDWAAQHLNPILDHEV